MSIVTGYKLEEKTKKIPKQWGLERFFIGNIRYIDILGYYIIQYKSSLCHYESSIQELQNHIHYLQEKISKTENADLFYEQLSFEKKKTQILKQKVVEYAETIQYLKDQLQLYSVVNVKELELTIKNRDNIIYSLKKRLEMYQHKYDILQQNLYNKDVTISELSKMLKFYQQHYNAK